MPYRYVVRHPIEASKRSRAARERDEDLLRDIFGGIRRSEHLPAEPIDRRLMTSKEHRQRLAVAFGQPRHEV